jgi:hypothetical protein
MDLEDIIFTKKGKSLEELKENDYDQKLLSITLKTHIDHMVKIRKIFEKEGYNVWDSAYRRHGIGIFYIDKDQFEQQAKLHIQQCKIENKDEKTIVNSVDYPLRTFVIRQLNASGSCIYTDSYIERNRAIMYDKGPDLSPAQTEQVLDAYYWTHLAPDDKKIDYSHILKFYEGVGRYVRKKNAHEPTGSSRGRSSTSGKLRNFRGSSRAQHNILPSPYVKLDEQGNPIAKNTSTPRKINIKSKNRYERKYVSHKAKKYHKKNHGNINDYIIRKIHSSCVISPNNRKEEEEEDHNPYSPVTPESWDLTEMSPYSSQENIQTPPVKRKIQGETSSTKSIKKSKEEINSEEEKEEYQETTSS